MAILGGDWDHGTMGFNGKVYKFKLTGKDAGGLYVRNDKGVVLKLKTHGEGVALSIGVQGITIQMEK
jgi:hypothetical protein